MANYEVMFILDPALEDDKKDATVETVKTIIAKKAEGYYVVVEFKAPHTLPKELDRRLKISDNVMRHIIINKDEK